MSGEFEFANLVINEAAYEEMLLNSYKLSTECFVIKYQCLGGMLPSSCDQELVHSRNCVRTNILWNKKINNPSLLQDMCAGNTFISIIFHP
jgi:hypothetical protein